ncbi:cytochrome P450 [Russula earlei]|uniref:Cytochrome P450 n=1 Tax=Russula earlei TaxID=71964 RepID=A0ACC0UAT5_9AGAM|nr:cytochrome P450 [Russula earlei]
MNEVTPKWIVSRSLRAPTVQEIWEARPLIAGALFGLVIIIAVRFTRSPWRKVPPGPRRLPIIGNDLRLMNKLWLTSKDCKERFGEIVYLDAAGQPTILLNSLKSAYELLDRRASNYSDRPRLVMVQDILSNGLLFVLMNYGERWRRIRRGAHEAFTKMALQSYHPIQKKEATILVSSMLATSGSLYPDKQFQRVMTSTIMSILFDHPTIVSEEDQTITRIKEYNDRISRAAVPRSNLVDVFPWMIHIPKRFAKWKREGIRQFNEDYAMFAGLLNRVRVDMADGGNRPSLSASLIQNSERNRISEPEMSFLVGSFYAAQVQAELDAVVGRDRLPTFADAPHLPYLGAVVKEVLRWRPVLPLGVSHAATGRRLVQLCTPNIWNCNHDRAAFGEDADEFRPERHLSDDEDEERSSGHLKATQAGDLALDSLFINTARILWAAKLEAHPVPYRCVITPRFSGVVSLLAEERERLENWQ